MRPSAPRFVAVLDNEAATAIASTGHSNHRALTALMEAVAQRNRRSPGSGQVLVPTAVRVEARLDRRRSDTAALGRLRTVDVSLDGGRADRAAALSAAANGSAVDAAVAEVAVAAASDGAAVTVYTSDLTDLPRLLAAAGPSLRVGVRRV